MNTAVAPSQLWQTQVVRLLSPEDPEPAGDDWTFLQFEADRPPLDASKPLKQVRTAFSRSRRKSWLAVPLGPESEGHTKPSRDRIDQALNEWQRLPNQTPSSENIHQEIKQFADSLTESQIACIEESLWWFIPLGPFRLVRDLVEQFGPPPPEVERDWLHQRKDHNAKPPSLSTVVSPSGWLIDLQELIQPAPSALALHSLATPKRPPASARRPSQSTSARFTIVGTVAGVLLLACGALLWPGKTSQPSASPVESDSIAMADVAEPLDVNNGLPAEGIVEEAPLELTPLESTQLESTPLESAPLESISLEAISLESISGFEPMGAPKFETDVEPLDDSNAPVEEDVEPSLGDATIVSEDLRQVPSIDEHDKPRVVTEQIGFETWGQRREVRFGRGANAKNGWFVAHLRMGEPNAEKESEWLVSPSDEQGIQGNGRCEWRLAKEDGEVELVVRVFSKPGTRWQLVVLVGARTTFGAEPVNVAPGQVPAVLLKLQGHLRWLQQAQEAWQSAPRPPRIRGMPDAASYTRWLRAQQRDTEQAIKQWTRIAELVDVLQASGSLEYELSIESPTEPLTQSASPQAASHPAPGKAD